MPQPVEEEQLLPGETADGTPVSTNKWRYDTPDATFVVVCDRRASGSWGPHTARHSALGTLTQFKVMSTDTLTVEESPVDIDGYVGLEIRVTSPADSSGLYARFITRDTVALQLVARYPTGDPSWQSTAREFIESFRPDH